MNIAAPISLRERAETDAERLERIIAGWEAKHGRPFRDPEPTEAEIEEARQRADDAARGLLTDAELANLSRGHRIFNRRRA